MKDLQSIINERANKKLDADISKFLKDLSNSELWDSIDKLFYIKVSDIKTSETTKDLRSFFWHNGSTAAKRMKQELLPKYIERESKEFMEKVDTLKEDCAQLFEEEH